MAEVIEDAEIIDETAGTEIEVRPQQQGLFRTEDPVEFLAKASTTATALAGAVRKQKLFVVISGKDYVRYEGWSMLGSLLGVTAHTVWTRKLEDGWEARVEAHTLNGHIVGAAEAECLRSENLWKNRDDYALRSMAQTRAAAKALRQPLGFVMSLAGFEATPFEEMPPESETAAEEKPKGRKGGLEAYHRHLYAEFKKREEEGKLTQDDLKHMLKNAGAKDLAHATEEQTEQVLKWVLDVDIPFEETGPAEAGGTDGVPGDAPTAGGASQFADEADVDEFLELARARGDKNWKVANDALRAHRKNHDGNVRASYLATLRTRLLEAAPEPVAQELPI